MERNEKNNPGSLGTGHAVLRGVIAAYLVYLGASLVYDQIRGISSLSPLLVWTVGPLFVLSGLGFGLYTWRTWKNEKQEAAVQEKPTEQPPGEGTD